MRQSRLYSGAFLCFTASVSMWRLSQKSTVSQSCLQDCLDFAERMKRKALRVRSEAHIPPYVTEAESRKQHSDSPLCNSPPVEILHPPRRNQKILPNFEIFLPKFHFILPNFYFKLRRNLGFPRELLENCYRRIGF